MVYLRITNIGSGYHDPFPFSIIINVISRKPGFLIPNLTAS